MVVASRHVLSRLRKRSWKASFFQRWNHSHGDDLKQILKSLPWQYLRASDPSNYDNSTYQRTDVSFDVNNGKPIIENREPKAYTIDNISVDNDTYHVKWSDGRASSYPTASIQNQVDRWKQRYPENRIPWSGLTEEKVRESSSLSIPFSKLISNPGMKRAITTLYEYGILLVTETPVSDGGAGIAALGAALGGGSVKELRSNSVLKNYMEGGSEIMLPHGTDGPLRTLYGTVWSTISGGQADGASVADSAYGNDGLPLHTDMTYMRDPPGLQIFTMVEPAIEGGDSIFADGLALATSLREKDPEAFHVLSTAIRRYSCRDPVTGWQLEASGPVIQISSDNQIVGIRHNDLDRLPDLPPSTISAETDIDDFYAALERAHTAWDSLISQDKFRLVMKLQPGDTMIVANQVSFSCPLNGLLYGDGTDKLSFTWHCSKRCMHGRYGFSSSSRNPRSVMGCYIGQDELYSRMRMEGFHVT
eukprot:scaffold22599_cov139-Cylindrotheca_fusiformis.AAC.14